jgi:hypothetical protein
MLFHDADSNVEILAFNNLINVNDELERMYKEKTLTYFSIPSRYFLTATAKNIK